MRVYISGKNSKVSNREMRYAAQYFAHMLLGPRLSRSISIFIKNEYDDGFHGSVTFLDDNHMPRSFDMSIDPAKGKRAQLLTLAHEMVHVKQYARGELKTLFNHKENRWKGRYITDEQFHYYDQPWEIEAFGRELGLYNRFINHVKNEKVKFDKPFNPKMFPAPPRQAEL
jgi:hypothetical protein